MRLSRQIRLELALAGVAVLAAGAFVDAAGAGQARPLFQAVEQQAGELGKKIFLGKGNCATCHGQDAKGGVLAPNLTDGEWLQGDGSVPFIEKTVREGVARPKQHPAPMPPMGGAKLSEQEVQAVAGYVKAQSQPGK